METSRSLNRRLDALEEIARDAYVRDLLDILADEGRQSGLKPFEIEELIAKMRPTYERWYVVRLGLKWAGVPEREIVRQMGTFLGMDDETIAAVVAAL
jgi:hypothetical protein